jgi:hypothetical protein
VRSVGARNAVLNEAATALAKRLAGSNDGTTRATGKEVLRELAKPAAKKRLAIRARR